MMTLDGRPVLLFACGDQWMSRSLGSILEEHGFSVVVAASGALALTLARRVRPDVVLLDDYSDSLDAVSVCRALHDDPLFDCSTPIVISSPTHLERPRRMAAYEAGAWEFYSQPFDIEQLRLKLGTFLRARQELARARAYCFIDPATGLYSEFGLEQLCMQLGSRAMRTGESLACLAITTEPREGEPLRSSIGQEDRSGFADIANLCRLRSRQSDVVGHSGKARLGILAPDTDAQGTRSFVARLQHELDDASQSGVLTGEFQLRAGYCSVADLGVSSPDSVALIRRAEAALDHLLRARARETVIGYEQLPVT
jgi:PleD family two-component response regulator